MGEEKRARLEKTWAHAYRTKALPLIDEERFRSYFHGDDGRPNKSVRLVVSVLVFKEIFDLTDGETLEQLEWSAAWHYALDVEPDEAHTCQKTLHNFRAKLLADDEGAGLFEKTTAGVIESAQLSTRRQRQDSTHTVSNIRILTRLGLFTATITGFLEALRKEHPRLCVRAPQELRERYLDREGYFGDAKSSEAPRRLSQAALDTHALVTLFSEHKTVAAMATYALLARLYTDQCEPPEVASPERIDLRKDVSSSSLQSPSDPDATYGHKGKGYEAQLAETCDETNPFQVLTAASVNGAHESDQQYAIPVLEQTERTCGTAPDLMHADCGFGSGENILTAREHGTELLAPIGAKAATKYLPMARFEFDGTGEQVLRCPAGAAPVKHRPNRTGTVTQACFSKALCAACPLRAQCPTEERSDYRVLEWSDADFATLRRRIEQETPEFKELHKARSALEGTNSELKRCHGLRKLRVRTKPRVSLSVRLKAMALNLKRYVAHLTRTAAAAASPMATCAC
jgi:hypothetical protein